MTKKRRFLLLTVMSTAIILASTGCGKVKHPYDAASYPKKITVTVFDSFANYEGLQSGWFAKEVMDHFNMKLELIAPNLREDGSGMMDVRAAAGNIGDIIITSGENEKLEQLVSKGLVADISKYLDGSELMEKYGTSVRMLNDGLDGIYAVQGDMSTLPASESNSILEPNYAPYVRWDYYKELGYPAIGTLEDLLPVLEKMQELHPRDDDGNKVYGFSFFPDWDGNMMTAAKQPACLYGYDEIGFLLVSADGKSVEDILEKDSQYMRALRFYNKAYRMGLVDPESRDQTYTDVFEKYKKGDVLFCPWAFLGQSAFNTDDHTSKGEGFMPVDIGDMKIYDSGCMPNGNSKKIIAVGSRAKDTERLANFIAWLYTDDGIYCNEANSDNGTAGPYGMCWEMLENGPSFTDFGVRSVIKKLTPAVPEEYGRGSFSDGISQLNFIAVNIKEKDKNGDPYSFLLWPSSKEYRKSALLSDWQQHMNAGNTMDYLTKNGKLAVSEGFDYPSLKEANEIADMRDAVRRKLVDFSWKMVFAADDAGFDEYYAKAKRICKALGYDKVVEYDRSDAARRQKMKEGSQTEKDR